MDGSHFCSEYVSVTEVEGILIGRKLLIRKIQEEIGRVEKGIWNLT